jgi:hypothetical protein
MHFSPVFVTHPSTGGEQNNGNTKKLRKIIVLATLKELQLSALNVVLPFVYNL